MVDVVRVPLPLAASTLTEGDDDSEVIVPPGVDISLTLQGCAPVVAATFDPGPAAPVEP